MAYTAVPTSTTGDLWTAANQNTYLRDNFASRAAWSLETQSTTDTTVASFDFTSIPTSYRDLMVQGVVRSTKAAVTFEALHLTVNNTAAGYYYIYSSTTTAGCTGTQGLNQNQTVMGNCPAATAAADTFSSFRLYFSDYADTTNYTNVRWEMFSMLITASGNIAIYTGGARMPVTAAIDQITIFPAANNLAANCTATLYGLK